MGKIVQITCDGCGEDLTYTGNCEDYYLVVSYSSKVPLYVKEGLPGGVVTAVAIAPPIKCNHYFCDLRCLDHWSDRRRHVALLSHDWWEQWKSEHGTRDNTGHIRSYPSPPQEISDARNAEFAAAALLEFPMARHNR